MFYVLLEGPWGLWGLHKLAEARLRTSSEGLRASRSAARGRPGTGGQPPEALRQGSHKATIGELIMLITNMWRLVQGTNPESC